MKPEWFAGRLRELREAAGLTQTELAIAAGLTRSGIAGLEMGARYPAWETALALATALAVSLDALAQPPKEAPGVALAASGSSKPTRQSTTKPKGRKKLTK